MQTNILDSNFFFNPKPIWAAYMFLCSKKHLDISDNMENSTGSMDHIPSSWVFFTSFPNVTVDKWKYWLPEIWSSFFDPIGTGCNTFSCQSPHPTL